MGSLKAKRRHFTIKHQAQLLVHNCGDCRKRYQTRNSLTRHVDKKYMSSKGMTRPALETTIEQESLLLVKKPDVPPETENTTKHVSHSPVYTNNGETVYSEQQILTVPNMMNRPLPTTDCDTLDDFFNLSEFLTTDPTIAPLLPNNVLAELSESQIRLPVLFNRSIPLAQLPTSPLTRSSTPYQTLDIGLAPICASISNGMNLDLSTLKCDSQPQVQSVERPSTTSDKVAVATLTQRPTLSLQDYPSSSSSVSRTHFHPSESNGSTDNATDTPAPTQPRQGDANSQTEFSEVEIRRRINVIALLVEEFLPGRGETMGELLLFQYVMTRHPLF